MIGLVGRPRSFHKHNDFEEPIVSEPLATDYHTSPPCSNLKQSCRDCTACQFRSCQLAETEAAPNRWCNCNIYTLFGYNMWISLTTIMYFGNGCKYSCHLPQIPMQAKLWPACCAQPTLGVNLPKHELWMCACMLVCMCIKMCLCVLLEVGCSLCCMRLETVSLMQSPTSSRYHPSPELEYQRFLIYNSARRSSRKICSRCSLEL